MKIERAAVFSALLLCTAVTFAQTPALNNSFSSTLSGGINLRAIAGAPLSAEVMRESVKVLPDGSSVPVVTRGKMFRDSEGRTRSEMELVAGVGTAARQLVTIVDPVAHVSMVLDPQTKTATVTPLPAAVAGQSGKLSTSLDAERVSAKSLVIRGTEDLGVSTVEGFSVSGLRRSRPAAPGQGSGKIIIETWFSPELKIELQAKITRPDGGATSTKLQNIVAGEPDRLLFEAPTDYAVKTTSPSR
jgi:hypothetical protein